MPFLEVGGLKLFAFESFQKRDGLLHGIFTRHGGVSPSPWASLNIGGTVGDTRDHVIENRKRIFDALSRPVETIFDSWQVHGTEVLCVQTPRPLNSPHQKADAILTDRDEVTLLMRFADCVPILLYDPIKRVVGLVHAGWRGTVSGIAGVAVNVMASHYGCSPINILAGIGPSISVEHYQVGEEVVGAVKKTFEGDVKTVLWQKKGFFYMDLWQANHLILSKAGVRAIELSNLCTAADNGNWYSHRAEHGKTGRFAAVIALRNGI